VVVCLAKSYFSHKFSKFTQTPNVSS
jgi:hypothetical protein